MELLDVDDPTAHPRPLLRRPGWSLDGPWSFAAAIGEAHDRTIEVPFAPETPASGIGEAGIERCSYRRVVAVPEHPPGERVLLHFGAVDRVATVRAGGEVVAHHEGGYVPFEVDVTDHVRDGEVEIVVDVEDPHDDLDAPRGKQEWRPEPHSIWYPPTTGIWRSVWLERAPAARVEALDWTADVAAMRVGVRARVAAGAVAAGLSLRVRLRSSGRVVAEGSARVMQPEVTLSLAVGDGGIDDANALVWWPRRPVLLDAEVALVDDGGDVVDDVRSYTALRSVRVEDGAVVLNGRPTFLRFVLDQGYWRSSGLTPPDTAALARDLELTRALGFNGARKHQKTEDPRWFAWADRLGMLAWVELPSAYRPGPVSARRLLDEWAAVVEAYRNHPSVIGWVPINESWGVPAAASDPPQRALIEALAAMTNALDGTRPVAVVLSEFGGIALAGEGTWGYQQVATAGELLERYRDLWAAVHASDTLAGACWTQLTDTYQEANGLLTMDRVPKGDLEAFSAATRGTAR